MSYQLFCCGDATDIATASSTPYFLLQAGLKNNLVHSTLVFKPERLRWQRRLWNLQQWIRTRRAGGFQYSDWFLKSLWKQARLASLPASEPRCLLSYYPFLPPAPWPASWRVGFYIDATTHQVFEDYGSGVRLDPKFKRQVLMREQLAYQAAKAVVTMSEWAAESVRHDYGISSARVHVVPAGANLDEQALLKLPPLKVPPPPSPENPLRLGFIGKEWYRKGGPFLLKLAESLEECGVPTIVRVIGPPMSQLPSHRQLHPLGFIDKRTEMTLFAKEVQSWHFGTLFSTVEAFGISNRECLRLGVPVLATAVGGIPSTISDQGCGQLFEIGTSPHSVAHWIMKRLNPFQAYEQWRHVLLARTDEFSWDTAVAKLSQILN